MSKVEGRDVVVRTFAAELATTGDGRTVDLLIVPYGTVATVADPPLFEAYDEMWEEGAFDNQLTAANRVSVFLNFEHQDGLGGIIGHGADLRSSSDGLEGSFRIHETADGEKALHMVRENILTGVSLEAMPLRSVRRDDVVVRERAHLDKVALCRAGRPAYKDAAVLAVRTKVEIPRPNQLPDEVVEGLKHFGINVEGKTE